MSDAVTAFYAQTSQIEWDRLDTPFSKIEFLSTLRLIDKYLPGRGRVLDVGGGPGRYTIELLKRGYAVSLFDLSSDLIAIADQHLKALHLAVEGLYTGDARKLGAFEDNSFDVLLVMGPLYHLLTRSDRLLVLKEARRVLKPGGRAIMTYLNCWGLIRTGLTDFPDHYKDPQFVQSMFREGGLGIWYWSNPDLAQAELSEAGFQTIVYAGAEGFAGGMQPIINRLAQENPRAYDEVLKAAVESSELACYRDTTEHIHFLAT